MTKKRYRELNEYITGERQFKRTDTFTGIEVGYMFNELVKRAAELKTADQIKKLINISY